MTRLRIQAFGGLHLFAGAERPLLLPAKKAQALLAYLTLHPGRPHLRGKLAAMLWSDSNEAQARASLRQALLVLRKALVLAENELIAGSGETIELVAGCIDADVLAFERLVADGSRGALEEAARLYTGEFLEALDLRQPAFDDWLMERRHHLRERAVTALTRLLAQHSDEGATDRAIEVALRLLSIDPLQESVHRSLMQLYAKQGRPASALRQFQMCRDLLARELGTQPQPQTLQLRDTIERQRRAPAASPAVAVEATPSAQTMELRPVAVVVVEPSAIAEENDPERGQELSERFVATAAEVVARFGGTLERRLGTGVGALFGAPAAHGNDVERAARCALELRNAARDLRIGVSYGTALITHKREASDPAFTVNGEPLGLAARLAAAAAPGDVLLSERAWRVLARFADGTRCLDMNLPASLRPVGCWQLTGFRAAPQPGMSLVGRRTELSQFTTSLDACRRNGTGLTIHVRGEPGIGKTRLVEEFRAIAAAQGFLCHGGVVMDFGSSAERDAPRKLVRGLLGVEHEDENAERVAIEQAIATGLVEAAREIHLLDLLHRPLPAAQRAVFDAMDHATREREQNDVLAVLLERSCAQAPRLLVLEDLHWAPARTLDRAATLAATAERCAAVLVTTSRGDGDPLNAAWRSAAGVSALITLDLGPLRWAEASALAAQFGAADDAFLIRCVERSGGNPLFLEQLLRSGHATDSALPGSVQSVVQARLDTLRGAERHAVRVASVLGQRFSLSALSHLLGGAAWEPEQAQGLLRIEGGDGVFAHALVHEGAYASLPRTERRALHAKAALWFTGRDTIFRAEHLDRADDQEAAQAYLDAAHEQAAKHRNEHALRLAARGIELVAPTGPRFALACARADLLHDLGAMPEAQAAYEQALAFAADDTERCRAWLGLAAVLRVRDDLPGAEDALALAEQAATARGLTEQLARIHFLLGNLFFPRGDLEGCRREHERSLALARDAGSAELEAAALGGLGDAAYLRGQMLTARTRFADCVVLAQRHGLKRVEAANRPMAGITLWYAGNTRGALEEVLAAIVCAAQIGHRRAEAIARHGAYQFSHALMQFDAALAHADRALDLARQINAPRFEAEALAFRGEVLRTTGKRAPALDDLRHALKIAGATGMSYLGPVFLGMLAVATDDDAERAAVLAEGETLLATNTLAHNHLLFRRDAIDASLAVGDWATAKRHAAELEKCTQSERLPWSDFFAARGRALADRGAGRVDGATRAELSRLRIEGERIGLLVALAAIDEAMQPG